MSKIFYYIIYQRSREPRRNNFGNHWSNRSSAHNDIMKLLASDFTPKEKLQEPLYVLHNISNNFYAIATENVLKRIYPDVVTSWRRGVETKYYIGVSARPILQITIKNVWLLKALNENSVSLADCKLPFTIYYRFVKLN